MYSRFFTTFALRVCSIGLVFISSVILARVSKPDDFGVYSLILSWAGVISLLWDWGCNTYFFKSISKFNILGFSSAKTRVIARLIIIKAKILTTTIPFLIPVIVFLDLPVLSIFVIALLTTIQLSIFCFNRAVNRQKSALIQYEILPNIIRIVMLTILFFAFGSIDLSHILVIQTCALSIPILFCGLNCRYSSIFLPLKKIFFHRSTMKYIKNLVPIATVNVLLYFHSQLDILLLGFFDADSADIAGYAISQRVSMIIGIVASVATLVIPYKLNTTLTRSTSLEAINYTLKTTVVISLLVVAQTSFIIYFSHDILMLWGENYTNYDDLLKILVLGQSFVVSCCIVGHLFFLSGKQKYNSWIEFSGFFLNVALGGVLYFRYGIYGCAYATLITFSLMSLLRVFLLIRYRGYFKNEAV
ncbi:oligosaccharide flippase family protein [Vibrio harveyi]|uniref:oligosaccharide flippase family protein n=1 Tax=Vibrio TaxID=662 RepID=UPI0022CDB398|nr:oligosaccharide flippase family protein [Vibrio sp. NFR]MDA0132315.1 oligosaccharide flippase family protein [Vibrio sp. NFR]